MQAKVKKKKRIVKVRWILAAPGGKVNDGRRGWTGLRGVVANILLKTNGVLKFNGIDYSVDRFRNSVLPLAKSRVGLAPPS